MSVPSAPVPLGRRVLRDSAYDLLLTMLLDGSLPAGAGLSIDGLARELGVSPTPIREALVHLEHTGLVSRTALRGYRVAPLLTAEQIAQLVDARAIIELGALELALRHRDRLIPPLRAAHEQHLRRIAEIDADENRQAEQGDPPSDPDRVASYRRYFEADWGFHQVILEYAGNPFLMQFSASLGAHVHRLRQTIGVGLTDSHEAGTEHSRILEALERGAPDLTVLAALREHLEAVRRRSMADSVVDP